MTYLFWLLLVVGVLFAVATMAAADGYYGADMPAVFGNGILATILLVSASHVFEVAYP